MICTSASQVIETGLKTQFLQSGLSRCVLLLSVGRPDQRAMTFAYQGDSFEAAWAQLSDAVLGLRAQSGELNGFRLECVVGLETTTLCELKQRLVSVKRNYYTHGLAMAKDFSVFFHPMELAANAMLYPGGPIEHAQFNEGNVRSFIRRKYPGSAELTWTDSTPIYPFQTRGFYYQLHDQTVHELVHVGAAATGRRTLEPLTPEDCRGLIEQSSQFLARQVQHDGSFVYGLFPCFDRRVPGYNTLRHASTTYAMLEALEAYPDDALSRAIDAALNRLINGLIRKVTLPNGATAAFVWDEGDEIKLGGSAVAILALCKHAELTGSRQNLALLEQLAAGVIALLNPQTGQFTHVLNYPDLTVKAQTRIIYYDGEAAFALMRLYQLTRKPLYLMAVEKAFEYFIQAKHWQANDHWLSYCVNELTRYKPERRYFEFGVRNFINHLDFVKNRITTFPTLLELMMAAHDMLNRMRNMPELNDLLQQVPFEYFYEALHTRANYLRNGFFWPEWAMFFANPATLRGAFFIRHHSFRVRIDDIEHYLSGLIAYSRLLKNPPQGMPTYSLGDENAQHWNAHHLRRASQGIWAQLPMGKNWHVSGVCPYLPSYQQGHMVAIRAEHEPPQGIPFHLMHRLQEPVAAVLCTDQVQGIAPHMPLLKVDAVGKAILDMGFYARSHFRGKVIGVTGSAGKTTTVAMLARALNAHGPTSRTEGNANLPFGVAWNLACMPWTGRFNVLEMAIGQMRQNTQLVRPDVAVITNIGAAHLEFHRTIEEVARKKARIFESMQPGSWAIIYRETACWDILQACALQQRLNVLSYGQSDRADVQLASFDSNTGQVMVCVRGQSLEMNFPVTGVHNLLNALACVAVSVALELPLETTASALGSFEPLRGRGEQSLLKLPIGEVTLIDQSYNANPVSMRAALAEAAALATARDARLVLVLGDMLELGEQSAGLHTDLFEDIQRCEPSSIYLCGPNMKALLEPLSGAFKVQWFDTALAIEPDLKNELRPGDVLMLKASQGMGVHLLASKLTESFC